MWAHLAYVNGEPFKGQLQIRTTTDPVIPLERLLFGDTESVTITTHYWLAPDGGEPYLITPKSIKSMIMPHGTVTAIEL